MCSSCWNCLVYKPHSHFDYWWCQVPVCVQDLPSHSHGGTVQTAFFKYWLINLIFIFQKEVDAVIRGVLVIVRRNMVYSSLPVTVYIVHRPGHFRYTDPQCTDPNYTTKGHVCTHMYDANYTTRGHVCTGMYDLNANSRKPPNCAFAWHVVRANLSHCLQQTGRFIYLQGSRSISSTWLYQGHHFKEPTFPHNDHFFSGHITSLWLQLILWICANITHLLQ